MIGWKIILLANSGGLEGKLVLFACSLQELSLIKAGKLSYVMLKLREPVRPSHSRTGIEGKQYGSNEHEGELSSVETFQSRLKEEFFLPFGKSKNL